VHGIGDPQVRLEPSAVSSAKAMSLASPAPSSVLMASTSWRPSVKQSVSIVVDPRDHRAPLDGLVRSQEEVFLDPSGCPVCEYCVEAEDQFFRWFTIEAFADPAMHARLRQSAGFCPRHERRALGIDQLSPVPAIVRGAIAQLGEAPPERAECPACASVRQAREHAEAMLGTALRRRALRERYTGRDSGVCAGVDDVRAQLLPHDKGAAVAALAQQAGPVAMVGDGINDAPALAVADVGIAMGASGSTVALETADVALMADELDRLPAAIGLARRAMRVVHQNVALSLAAIVVLVTAALAGQLTLTEGLLLNEGTALLIIANGLRLLRRPQPA
jgi:haloacid dehalogenase-like hydrolase